jgi:adenylate cyclase
MPLRDRWQVSIRTGLSAGAIAAVLVTAAIVHTTWSWTSRANIAELNQRLNEQVIKDIGEKVDRLLDNAVAARQAVATNIAQSVIDIATDTKREFLFLSFLQSQPSLSSIEFAWLDDHAFGVRRTADDRIVVEETTVMGTDAVRSTYTYQVNAEGELLFSSRTEATTEYRATQQFWFRTAFDNDMPTWSDIHRLPASGTLGVTTAHAVQRQGSILGVAGVSIALDRISAFLDGVEISTHGTVLLTNRYGELVAIQKRAADALAGPRENIVRLEDSALPAVGVMTRALQSSQVELGAISSFRHFSFQDRDGESYFVTAAPLAQMGLIVAVVIPETDILGGINRNIRVLLIGLLGLIAAGAIAAALLARSTMGAPLARIAENMRQIEGFELDRITPIPSHFRELRQVSDATMRMRASLASFRKYIPTELVRTLFAEGIEAKLGGEHRTLSIMFMDLAHFTRIAERLGEELVGFLAEYLSEMSALIQAEQGTIDKYIGDAVMAFWGAPIRIEQHAVRACRAALACQRRLEQIRAAGKMEGAPELHARIGLNTGRVLVGNVGSHDRLNYTVIGDPVNVASRLEALNKVYGTQILIGEDTYAAASPHVLARAIDRVAVYGREQGIEVFELITMRDLADAATLEWVLAYERAASAFRIRDWDRAIEMFERVIELRGGKDQVSAIQIERARTFKSVPPPADWNGLVTQVMK